MAQEKDKSWSRRRFKPEEKFKVVKEQLTTDQSVTEICKKYKISSVNFYRWQDQFFQAARNGLEGKSTEKKKTRNAPEQEEAMKSEIARMREVIAEVTSENVTLKKKTGESDLLSRS